MRPESLRLRDDLHLGLLHRDATAFGSATTGLIDQLIRHTCRSVLRESQQLDAATLQARAPALLEPCFGPAALGQLYRRPGQLREDCLYPHAEDVTATRLVIDNPALGPARICGLDPRLTPELARWLSEWKTPSLAPRSGPARALWSCLDEAGALTSAEPERVPTLLPELTFVGHATVALRRAQTTLVFDPFFLPPTASPSSYRPLSATELSPDAVFITHSHPDHYDVGSLALLGADTRIFVPEVERESLLAIDMATRLRGLGFTRVQALKPGARVRIGPWQVVAEALVGEQPSDTEVLHPECPNVGLIYLVEADPLAGKRGPRIALLADAGRDHRGDCVALARRLRRERGPIDVLLSGFRAWHLTPAQFLSSSVARYLLFVPRDQWGRRYSIMNGAEEVVEIAQAWGAHTIIPYANGGAPWYWERGLGPRLDDREDPRDDTNFDPDLGPLQRALARAHAGGRGSLGCPRLRAVHPGEGLDFDPKARLSGAVQTTAGGFWPYADSRPPAQCLEVA